MTATAVPAARFGDWYFVKLDETQHWQLGPIAPLVSRIFGVYYYDAEEATYCCEMTPSRWLEALESQAEYARELTDAEREQVDAYLREGDNSADDSSGYYHCHTVDSLPELANGFDFPEGRGGRHHYGPLQEPCEDAEEAREELFDYAICNGGV